MNMKRLIAVLLSLALSVPAFGYDFSETRKDTPADFNAFLDDCTLPERIQIMQSLQGLSSEYNTMELNEAVKAVNSGKLSAEKVSPSAIRKAVVWRAYNKITYLFRNDKEIDYHGILQWAAKKSDVTSRRIDEFSTYRLEREVSQEYFAKVWDKLSPAERTAMLAGVAALGAAALGGTTALGGVAGVAALGGAAAYGVIAASTVVPIIPMVATVCAVLFKNTGAESGTVSAFIMTVNIIKTRKYVR